MRLFVSIDIPNELKANLAKLQNDLPQDGITFVDQNIFHITVKFIGGVPDQDVDAIAEAINSIKFEPFKLRLEGVGVFPNEEYVQVIWVGGWNEAFNDIANKVDKKLGELGIKRNNKEPSIHVTLGRVKKKIDLKKFLEEHKTNIFGEFTVSEIRLKKVILTPEGPVYEEV